MAVTLTVEQLQRERADHLAYLAGMLLEKPRRALEARQAEVERQLALVRRSG